MKKAPALKLTGNVLVTITNTGSQSHDVIIADNAYKAATINKTIAANSKVTMVLNLEKNHNWYDFSVKAKSNAAFEERFAGRVETGLATKTDPLMGGVV
jgi:phospholipase C